jgi:hypothetical protein
MQKQIEVNGKTFIVRELLAIETDDFNWEDKKDVVKKQVMISANLNEEEYKKLTLNERLSILKAFNEINGFL